MNRDPLRAASGCSHARATLRRSVPASIAALALLGCEPSLPKGSTSAALHVAVFDPATAQLPLPNDLAWLQAPATPPRNAREELVQLVASRGGFPDDEEAPIAIDLQRTVVGPGPARKSAPPAVDASTLGPSTLLVLDTDLATGATVPGPALEPEYLAGADRGTLVLHNPAWSYDPADPARKSRRWKANHRYAVVLRGGPSGAKLQGGGELSAMPALYLLTQGVVSGQELPGASLALPQNEYLLPGDTRAARAQAGAQLERLRQGYLPLFAAVDQVWGTGAAQQIVSIQTFTIAPPPAGTRIVTDASAGAMPHPSDFVLAAAAASASGSAALAAAAGGFSTTATLLSQASGPIAMDTVKDAVFLYDLSDPAHPARVKEATEGAGAGYLAEPLALGARLDGSACTSAGGCFSTTIALQPAVTLPTTPPSSLPPLRPGTEYAVLVTDAVLALNPAGAPPLAPLQPSTLGRVLLFRNPLVDASGRSLLPGEPDATAQLLEHVRRGVAAAAAALAAEKPAYTLDRIVLGYTFRTAAP